MVYQNEIVMDLNRETDRLKTFKIDWPHAYIFPKFLAKTGLYYIGPYDQVKCNFCAVQLSNWDIGDNELKEHYRWSINCPLLNRKDTLNVPIQPESDLIQLLSIIDNQRVNLESPFIETPVNLLRNPDFPGFSSELIRLNSFETWPISEVQKPEQLSKAGFFYTKKDDRVICFSCDGGLYHWDKNDDPWEQHALWFERCEFLLAEKGEEFIRLTKQKFEANRINRIE